MPSVESCEVVLSGCESLLIGDIGVGDMSYVVCVRWSKVFRPRRKTAVEELLKVVD